jgi:hypothetical protein
MLRNRGILSNEAKTFTKQLIKECKNCVLEVDKGYYERSTISFRDILTSHKIE